MYALIKFGILSVIIGNIIGFLVSLLLAADLPEVCKDWNKYYAMEVSLFMTGIILYLLTNNEMTRSYFKKWCAVSVNSK